MKNKGFWLVAIIALSCQPQKKEINTFLGENAQFTESGLEYVWLKNVEGPTAQFGNEVTAVCMLKVGDSTVVWEAPPDNPFIFVYSGSGMIKGFIEAIGMMSQGDKLKVVIPPDLGYGNKANGPIPAGAYLSYELELRELVDPKLWVADSLLLAFQQGGKEEGFALYEKMKLDSVRYGLNERQLGVLASLLKRDGRLNDAFDVTRFRAEEYSRSFGAHWSLANLYIERGENSRAKEELNKCLEIDPQNPSALRLLDQF